MACADVGWNWCQPFVSQDYQYLDPQLVPWTVGLRVIAFAPWLLLQVKMTTLRFSVHRLGVRGKLRAPRGRMTNSIVATQTFVALSSALNGAVVAVIAAVMFQPLAGPRTIFEGKVGALDNVLVVVCVLNGCFSVPTSAGVARAHTVHNVLRCFTLGVF